MNNLYLKWWDNQDKLLPPKDIMRITGDAQTKTFGGCAPTYISVCPHCGFSNKWATTGLIVPVTCENCKQLYAMFDYNNPELKKKI